MDKPNRYNALPEQIMDWLRTEFPEDVLLLFQQWIGGLVIDQATDRLNEESMEQPPLQTREFNRGMGMAAMRLQDWTPMPSVLLCSRHLDGCPGFPKCRVGTQEG